MTHTAPKSAMTIIYGTALLSVMGVASILPVLPDMARAFDVGDAAMGILVLCFTLPGIVLAPLGGILADRLGRTTVLVPCLLLFAGGGLMAACAQSLTALIAWRVVQGSGAACLGVLYNTIIGDIFTQERDRLRTMGKAAALLSLGAAIFPAVGGILGEWGWRWPLLLSLLALPLAFLCIITALPKVERSAMPHYARRMRAIVCTRRAMAHFGVTLCAFMVLYGPLITYFPLYAVERFAASPAAIGGIFALGSFGTALAAATLGRAAARGSLTRVLMWGALFFILSMLLLPLTGLQGYLWVCAVPLLCYGIGQGLAYPAVMASLSGLAPAEGRGALMAVNGAVLRLAQTISPLLCGLAFFLCGFIGVFALGALVGLCMLWIARYIFLLPHAENA